MLAGIPLLFKILSVVMVLMVNVHGCSDENEVYLPRGGGSRTGDILCRPAQNRYNYEEAPAGCYCRGGYARNSQNKCVPTEQCDKTPMCGGANEIHHSKRETTNCELSCRRLSFKRQCEDVGQRKRSSNCFCIEGAARNDNGTCIPLVNCPMATGACTGTNEIFLSETEAPTVETACEVDTKQTVANQVKPKKAGCYCRDGYVRSPNGQCIERRYCGVKCPKEHEIFLPRGTAPRCENSCDTACAKGCLPLLDMPEGCYCTKGYCRNEQGLCVEEQRALMKLN